MKFYSRYSFLRNPAKDSDYIFENMQGKVPAGFDLPTYKKGNFEGKQYIRMTIPHSPLMRKYFAYTFETSYNVPFTSTEKLNKKHQTFGDGKKLGTQDLILFQFDENLEKLDIFFIRNKARTLNDKKLNFEKWANGDETLTAEQE